MSTHRRIHRRIATTGAVLTAGLSAAALAAPAQAASNPYTPQGVCGSGFGVIDKHELRTQGVQLGTVYLLYQASSGRNCVVTLKERAVGRKTPAAAYLKRQGAKGNGKLDYGRFGYYAGPKRVSAKRTCVRWGGGIRIGNRVAAYVSGFEHCS
jgi:serine/threonine-protein kinase